MINMCNILWTVVQNQQTITMKVCVKPQMRVLLPNISKFNWPSLQNTSNLLQNNTLQNISATTYANISDVVSSSNISDANTYISPSNMSNSSLNTYTPSVMAPSSDEVLYAPSPYEKAYAPSPYEKAYAPSPDEKPYLEEPYAPSPDEKPYLPSSDEEPGDVQVTPSPRSSTSSSSTSNFIRGATTGNGTSPMLNITSPSSSVEGDNITGMIFVISFSTILVIVLVACFLRIRHKKQLKVPCKQKKLKGTKYTSSVAPDDSIKRPKDYAIEYIGENKTKRQLPKRGGNETKETKTPHPPLGVPRPLSTLHTRPLPPLPIPPLQTVPERLVQTVPERLVQTVPERPVQTVPERPVPPLRTVPPRPMPERPLPPLLVPPEIPPRTIHERPLMEVSDITDNIKFFSTPIGSIF